MYPTSHCFTGKMEIPRVWSSTFPPYSLWSSTGIPKPTDMPPKRQQNDACFTIEDGIVFWPLWKKKLNATNQFRCSASENGPSTCRYTLSVVVPTWSCCRGACSCPVSYSLAIESSHLLQKVMVALPSGPHHTALLAPPPASAHRCPAKCLSGARWLCLLQNHILLPKRHLCRWWLWSCLFATQLSTLVLPMDHRVHVSVRSLSHRISSWATACRSRPCTCTRLPIHSSSRA